MRAAARWELPQSRRANRFSKTWPAVVFVFLRPGTSGIVVNGISHSFGGAAVEEVRKVSPQVYVVGGRSEKNRYWIAACLGLPWRPFPIHLETTLKQFPALCVMGVMTMTPS